ncbi:mechanosensitive ion channel [Deltaproteobacteria bacterium PRO3]|nr:mechanosensitive ion channel [Deltaproteobacteria bacterium PRO3]
MKRLWVHLVLWLSLLSPAAGQAAFPFDNPLLPGGNGSNATPAPQKKALTEAEVRTQQERNAQELEQAKQSLSQLAESAPQVENRYLNDRIQLLESLDLIYGDLLEAFASQKKILARTAALESEENQWKSGTLPKDFAVDFNNLDRLRGQEVEAKKNQRNREQIYKSRQEAAEEAKKDFQTAEQERRRAKEAVETAKDGAERAALEPALALAQLKSRQAELRLALRELEFEVAKNYRVFFQKQQTLNALEISYLEKRVRFGEEDLKRELNLLNAESEKLSQLLERQQKELQAAAKEYDRARKRLDENASPAPALIEEVEAKRLAQTALEQQGELLNDRLKRLKELEELWKRRYRLLSGKTDRPEIAAWQPQTRQYLDQLRRDEELSNLRLNSLRNSLVENEEKARAKGEADPEAKRWLQQQREALQRNIDTMQDHLASLALTRKLYEKFLAEQETRYAQVSFSDRMSRIWERFLHVWNYELTSVDDSPITVSKVFFAVILMVFGFMLARRLSGMLADRVLPRFGVTPGVAAALRKLTFYFLMLLFVLTALHLVRVPLTLFAVLGGAVAIGVGFGSQNLMNNFISGLILLIERPIKVGDIIETDGNAGVVEQIGGRSTQIRTFNNIHMIVPNSAFLEKAVVNWTLSDNMIRSSIRVGVDYGSNTRQVADILKKAASDHGKVLQTPEPIVLFSDFGNDSLVFDLFFWLKIQNSLERRLVESDLRFMIEGAFSEAGVNIAYPQRDVHLDTVKPLEVRVVGGDGAKHS